ncbi:MAG: NADH-quinone oxidoreductase subunit J [Terriglobia bacterium]
MTFYQVTFWFFATVTVVSALLVITRRNPVHSAIFLIVTLLSVAGLYLQLRAEFLAAVQIILYIGGVMVLFLFVILLVNLDVTVQQERFNRQWWVAGIAALVLAAELGATFFLSREGFSSPAEPVAAAVFTANTETIGETLFQNYMLPFEIASLLLLVAMIGAVIMAKGK